MSYFINALERRVGYDLNNDGYIGGEGWLSRLERATNIDFNRDNMIGLPPNAYNGYPSMTYVPSTYRY